MMLNKQKFIILLLVIFLLFPLLISLKCRSDEKIYKDNLLNCDFEKLMDDIKYAESSEKVMGAYKKTITCWNNMDAKTKKDNMKIVTDLLIENSYDQSFSVKSFAIRLIARLKVNNYREILLSFLDNEDRDIRSSAIFAMGLSEDPYFLKFLEEKIKHLERNLENLVWNNLNDAIQRLKIHEKLKKLNKKESIRYLEKIIYSDWIKAFESESESVYSPQIKCDALEQLSEISNREAVEVMFDLAEKDINFKYHGCQDDLLTEIYLEERDYILEYLNNHDNRNAFRIIYAIEQNKDNSTKTMKILENFVEITTDLKLRKYTVEVLKKLQSN